MVYGFDICFMYMCKSNFYVRRCNIFKSVTQILSLVNCRSRSLEVFQIQIVSTHEGGAILRGLGCSLSVDHLEFKRV